MSHTLFSESSIIPEGTLAKPLSGELLAVLIGSTLGDGHIYGRKGKSTASFSESHAVDQKGYLLWKRDVWGNRISSTYGQDLEKPNQQDIIGFRTRRAADLYPWWEMFYDHGGRSPKGNLHKLFSEAVVPHMTPLALAVWYMDDGTLIYNDPAFSSHPRNHEVGKKILRAFGVRGESYGKEYTRSTGSSYGVMVKGDQGKWLMSLMEPYVLPELRHKVRPVDVADVDGERLVELARNGATTSDLAGYFGVGRDVIRHKARQLGIGISHLRPLPRADLAGFVEEVATGARPRLVLPEKLLRELAAAEVGKRRMAARFGASHNIVDKYLKEYGIDLEDRRGGGNNKCLQLAEENLRRLWVDEHRTMHEMKVILGCSRSTIKAHLEAWGIDR